jgi:hypothetical protein
LAVRAVGSVAVLAGSGTAAHAVGTAMKTVSLEVARVTAIGSAHLGVLGRGEAALAAGRVVGRGSRTRTASQGRGGARGRRLGIAERLQVIGRTSGGGLVLAVVSLALGLERRAASSKAIVGTSEAATT